MLVKKINTSSFNIGQYNIQEQYWGHHHTFSTHDALTDTAIFDTLMSKGTGLYVQYVEPKLTKENFIYSVSGAISLSTYYSAGSLIGQMDSASFVKKAGISIGFTLFNTVFKPAVAQFVESFAEVNIHNTKYTYYSIRCIFEVKYCDELNKMTPPSSDMEKEQPESLLQDFSQFDMTTYVEKVNEGLSKLSIERLFLNGVVSATASEIKDFSYVSTGFDQYCQGAICKNWVSYYFKEGLKKEVKSLISTGLEHEQAYVLKTEIDKNESINIVEEENPDLSSSQVSLYEFSAKFVEVSAEIKTDNITYFYSSTSYSFDRVNYVKEISQEPDIVRLENVLLMDEMNTTICFDEIVSFEAISSILPISETNATTFLSTQLSEICPLLPPAVIESLG